MTQRLTAQRIHEHLAAQRQADLAAATAATLPAYPVDDLATGRLDGAPQPAHTRRLGPAEAELRQPYRPAPLAPLTCPLCRQPVEMYGYARIMQSEGMWETEAIVYYCATHFLMLTDRATVETQTEDFHANLETFQAIALQRDTVGTGVHTAKRGLGMALKGLFNLFFPVS